MKQVRVRIIILQYNRVDLLKDHLPSVLKCARASRHLCKVTVLDNCSQDGSAAYVRENFPEAEVFEARENKVLCSYNELAAQIDDEIMILLNNDISPIENFVDPLVEPFLNDPDLFFVATHGDRAGIKMHWGILEPDTDYPGPWRKLLEASGPSLSAGVGAFDREKFLALKGYDELYLPGRYEDVDLCYRGWKRGWKGLYQPLAKKFHVGGASFNKRFSEGEIQAMVFRNGILFTAKNIEDIKLLLLFFIFVPLRLLAALLTGKFYLFSGLWEAFQRMPAALRGRKSEKPHWNLRDCDVAKIMSESTPGRGKHFWLRKGVDQLARKSWLRKIFSWGGMYTLRPFFPLQYLLLRELSDCSSVLDLGCGRHSFVPIIPSSIHTVGVELFRAHYDEAVTKDRHSEYRCEDVTKVAFEDRQFDAVVILDVIEHLDKAAGEALLTRMERWAKKKVIVFTPNGFMQQHEYDGNPLLEHRSGWTTEDFRKRGYRVHGVRGFKKLRGVDHHDHDHDEGHSHGGPAFREKLADLTQIVSYHFPEQAFQLFAVKELQPSMPSKPSAACCQTH
ncbi:MAG: methyltransferase domain-containing protein [Candidatus Omnitrophica bacterium]|nr:methyltransferase domain-containing protein [Candidatus Omnitrophota bacterium]